MYNRGLIVVLILTLIVFSGFGCLGSKNQEKIDNANFVLSSNGQMKIYKDLEYAKIPAVDKKYLSLDLYLPAVNSEKPLPTIIYVHGGGWSSGAKDDPRGNIMAVPENVNSAVESGYAVANVNYRLSSEAVFPAQINDVKAAVRWLRANANKYNLDSDRFGVWGESAGGYLASLLAVSGGVTELEGTAGITGYSSRVQAAADWFGPVDFAKIMPLKDSFREYYQAAGQLLGGVGAKLENNESNIFKANPITYITPDDPPFLIMHGIADTVVPVIQSRELSAALKMQNVKVDYYEFAGEGHDLSKPDYLQTTLRFFDKYLKKQPSL